MTLDNFLWTIVTHNCNFKKLLCYFMIKAYIILSIFYLYCMIKAYSIHSGFYRYDMIKHYIIDSNFYIIVWLRVTLLI